MRNRNFVLLMMGESIAGTGMWIGIIGSMSFMQSIIPSDFMKGLILMLPLFVSLFLSPKAGTLIDHLPKHKVLFWATVVRCFSPACMFVAIGYESIFWMILAGVFVQMAATFYIPATYASIPSIVPQAELLKANGIYLNIATLSRVGGAAIGGILVAIVSLRTIYSVTLVCYLLLAFLLLPVRVLETETKPAQAKTKISFLQVFSWIKGDSVISLSLLNAIMLAVFMGGLNLLVINFSEVMDTPEIMGWVYTVEGSSVMLAGLLVKTWFSNKNLITVSTMFVFVFSLSLICMSMAHNMLTLLGSFALFGFSMGFIVPINTTIFQQQLSPDMRGRFFSFKSMMDRLLFQVAVLVAGACLDVFGVFRYVFILGLVTLAVGTISLVYSRYKALDVRQPTGTKVA